MRPVQRRCRLYRTFVCSRKVIAFIYHELSLYSLSRVEYDGRNAKRQWTSRVSREKRAKIDADASARNTSGLDVVAM